MEMRNLKTKDLPKMTKMIKKLQLKDFLKQNIDTFLNDDVPNEVLESLEGKTDEEKKEIISKEQERVLVEVVTSLAEKLIENYDVIYDEFNDFLAGLYNVKVKEVEEWDLDVFMENVYSLKEQDKIMTFFKTASQLK